MRQDYAEQELKSTLTKVLEEFGFSKPESVNPNEVDVTDQVEEAGPVDPFPFGDPVAVQVVNDTPTVVVLRGSVSWGGQTTLVTNGQSTSSPGPQLIVGKNLYRRSVIVVNNGTLGIALAPAATVKFPATGTYGSPLLPSGASVKLDTKHEVWAIADPASTGETVSVWEVYDSGAT